MEEHGNQPTMCSVLFMDIVDYSRKPVSAQIALKEAFNAILSNAIREVPASERIILDAGDGAALCFLGEPDSALKVALLLRLGLLSVGAHMEPPLQVRVGINHGPVRLVSNANEQPNVVGDGINVAHRVMAFAKPGQMLASRAYYDAVSRQTQKYVGMFRHEGSRTDRHVREHELYAIAPPGESTVAQPAAAPGVAPKQTSQRTPWELRALYIGGAAVLALFALFKFANRPAEQSVPVQAPPVAEAPAQLAASHPPVAEALLPPKVPAPAAEQKPEASSTPGAAEKRVVQPVPELSKPAVPAQKRMPASADATKQSAPQQVRSLVPAEVVSAEHAAMASVRFAITPWGEVYLDGKKLDKASPPLVELQVTPGKHKIEIRNTTFPPYTQSIELKAGDKIKIRHKFSN